MITGDDRSEMLHERRLLVDLVALLLACPDLPVAPVLDTALAAHDRRAVARGRPGHR